MAQLTYGIVFEYGVPSDSDGKPTTWKTIPDITSIPTLIGAPSNHDVTSLYDPQKVYLEGLPDNGGQLAFGAIFTVRLFAVVKEIRTAQDTANPYFRVRLPEPLSKAYVFRGTLAIPSNDEWQPDNPILGKLNITPSTAVDLEDVTSVK